MEDEEDDAYTGADIVWQEWEAEEDGGGRGEGSLGS